jgi:hypothetical protein
MSHEPQADTQPFIAHATAPRQETRPMSFKLNRALDVAVSVLIVILSISTATATALLHA